MNGTPLGQRAMEEKDKQSQTKEIKLLRQLLRSDDSTKREELLTDGLMYNFLFGDKNLNK